MLKLEMNWFIILLANFLILIYLLNIILFKPLVALFKERKNAIDGSLKTAEDLKVRKDELYAKMQKELAEARESAKEKYNEIRGEGLNRQKELLHDAHEKSMKIIEEARASLRQESEKASAKLKEEVEKYSEEIVNKLIKV